MSNCEELLDKVMESVEVYIAPPFVMGPLDTFKPGGNTAMVTIEVTNNSEYDLLDVVMEVLPYASTLGISMPPYWFCNDMIKDAQGNGVYIWPWDKYWERLPSGATEIHTVCLEPLCQGVAPLSVRISADIELRANSERHLSRPIRVYP